MSKVHFPVTIIDYSQLESLKRGHYHRQNTRVDINRHLNGNLMVIIFIPRTLISHQNNLKNKLKTLKYVGWKSRNPKLGFKSQGARVTSNFMSPSYKIKNTNIKI
jgi:hypothetical protein